MRASQYLSQFNLDVRHKEGRLHFVPDALSRLQTREARATNEPDEGILDALTAEAYPVITIVEMDEAFKLRVQDGYEQDPR